MVCHILSHGNSMKSEISIWLDVGVWGLLYLQSTRLLV